VSARTGRSVRQRRAAAELKRLRELALLTADEVAQRLGWSASKVSRVENARIRLKPDDVELLVGLYGVTGEQRATLIGLTEEDGQKKWWDAYADVAPPDYLTFISFEAEASSACNYEPMVIPGLLQTEPYARQVIFMWQSIANTPPADLERLLQVRLTRQRILYSDHPLELSVIIDEAVLRRQVGTRTVMREQLHHLVEVSARPNISVQILPLAGHHFMLTSPVMSLQIPDFGPVTYLEASTDGHLYTDDSSLIYQHGLVFEELSATALDPGRSRHLIKKVIDESWPPERD
jgi:transcriptional regulator with XRE-family HTH domain